MRLFKLLVQTGDGLFFEAGNVGAGNAKLLCNVALGHRAPSRKPVTKHDHHLLARRQHLLDCRAQPFRGDVHFHNVENAISLRAKHIHKCNFVAVFVFSDGAVDGNVSAVFFIAAKGHKHFVFYAPCGIGGKRAAFAGVESGYRLDKAYRADGDHVVGVPLRRSVLFRDVCHQPQVVFNQLFAGFGAALIQQSYVGFFLVGGKRFREGAAGVEVAGERKQVLEELEKHVEHVNTPNLSVYQLMQNGGGKCLLCRKISSLYRNWFGIC